MAEHRRYTDVDIARDIATILTKLENISNQVNTNKLDIERLNITVYENGLTSRVKGIYEWVEEQKKEKRELKKQDDQQEHELKVLGINVSATTHQIIIQGLITGGFVLLGTLITVFLAK